MGFVGGGEESEGRFSDLDLSFQPSSLSSREFPTEGQGQEQRAAAVWTGKGEGSCRHMWGSPPKTPFLQKPEAARFCRVAGVLLGCYPEGQALARLCPDTADCPNWAQHGGWKPSPGPHIPPSPSHSKWLSSADTGG